MNIKELVIIGSGPSGLTAGIYAGRANLHPLIIEGMEPGGQLTSTTEVENFPGFEDGVMGPELMDKMKNQAKKFGASFLSSKVISVDFSKRPFKITCDNNDEYFANSIILSTGATAKTLGLAKEKELIGRGISTCATCDGFFYRNKIVHVIGGGDTAMEDALFLTKFASKVYVVHRRDQLRASKPMQERAFKNEKIAFIWNSTVTDLISDQNGLKKIIVQNLETGKKEERPTDGLFYAIGHTPNTKFLNGQIKTNPEGYIITKDGHPDTNIEGVFACGDVKDPYYRQAIVASGSGAMAAMRAERFLEEN